MKINIVQDDGCVIFKVKGRLSTVTAPDLDEALSPYLVDRVNLVLDFADLEYICSAGLRVILGVQQTIEDEEGTLLVKHCNEEVMEVFEMTGFADFLMFE